MSLAKRLVGGALACGVGALVGWGYGKMHDYMVLERWRNSGARAEEVKIDSMVPRAMTYFILVGATATLLYRTREEEEETRRLAEEARTREKDYKP